MLTLAIPPEIVGQMAEQARAAAPIEACGILAGREGCVEKLYPMTNADQSTDHFMMEPAEQFSVVKDIRARGLTLLAVFHSHPETPARPSDEDIRLALTPGVMHVILSLADPSRPVIKGYEIVDGKTSPVNVVCA
ncbi:MAG: M67 family metallopeptidase [Sedimentisphaerales bacterium]|nr:M67 family metallopeptidase [Sedimentisphaerales bacterium]